MNTCILPTNYCRRRLPPVGLAALIIYCYIVAGSTFAAAQVLQQAAPNPAPAVGRKAIALSGQTLDGKSVSSDSFRGKPLIINFFASWCDPCREEMPLINQLAVNADKGGYHVLGIVVEDSRAAVTEFAKEATLAFPIVLDLNNKLKRAYRIFGPPATFFIDGKGIIRDVVLGPITASHAQEALKKISTNEKSRLEPYLER